MISDSAVDELVRSVNHVMQYLEKSTDRMGVQCVNASYRIPLPPADEMRKRADEIERKDELIQALRNALSAITVERDRP